MHARAANLLGSILKLLRGEAFEPQRPQAAVGAVSPEACMPSATALGVAVHSSRLPRSVAILDEVDLLMHPLRSELNFPIGAKQPLPLAPLRWLLPMHLLRAVLAAEAASLGAGDHGSEMDGDVLDSVASADARQALGALVELIRAGVREHALQVQPHLVLLRHGWYSAHMGPHVGRLAYDWLLQQPAVQADFQRWASHVAHTPAEVGADPSIASAEALRESSLTFLTGRTPSAKASGAADAEGDGARIEADLQRHGSALTVQLFVLARQWVTTFVPHVLSKVNRVGYGLLPATAQAPAADTSPPPPAGATVAPKAPKAPKARSEPLSRQLLAVPFIGKDVPSPASEFAHPDCKIGLTFAAYAYEGLRPQDMARIAAALKQQMLAESGPFSSRPSRVLFQSFIDAAVARYAPTQTDTAAAFEQHGGLRRATSRRLGRQASTEGRRAAPQHQHPHPGHAEAAAAAASAAVQCLPLEFFQPADPAQMAHFTRACRRLPQVLAYHLHGHVFPATTASQRVKLSTSGHDLGSRFLFETRLGFSGTTSDQVPLSLLPVGFESASEAAIFTTLTSARCVMSSRLPQWTVFSLLQWVAGHPQRFSALIDIGALITGLSNKAVAAALLTLGMPHADGCVYLDSADRRMVLLRPRADDAAASAAAGGSPAGTDEDDAGVSDSVPAAESEDEASEEDGAPGSERDTEPNISAATATGAPAAPPLPKPEYGSLLQMMTSAPFKAMLRATPIPLAMCGVPKERLATYFDAVHTTGTDVPQKVDAVAAVTIGKGTCVACGVSWKQSPAYCSSSLYPCCATLLQCASQLCLWLYLCDFFVLRFADVTFRDFSQGAYRMRGLGQGQRIHVVITDEIAKLIGSATGAELPADGAPAVESSESSLTAVGSAARAPQVDVASSAAFQALPPSAVASWLLFNSIRMESLQYLALLKQRAAGTWRHPAMHALLSTVPTGPDNTAPVDAPASAARFGMLSPSAAVYPWLPEDAAAAASACEVSERGLNAWKLPIDHSIPATIAPSQPFVDGLRADAAEHSATVALAPADIQLQLQRVLADAVEAVTAGPPTVKAGGAPAASTAAAPDGSELSHDTEQVQEQEQEQEQQKEQEEERMDATPVDPLGVTPWPILLAISAVCAPRSAPSPPNASAELAATESAESTASADTAAAAASGNRSGAVHSAVRLWAPAGQFVDPGGHHLTFSPELLLTGNHTRAIKRASDGSASAAAVPSDADSTSSGHSGDQLWVLPRRLKDVRTALSVSISISTAADSLSAAQSPAVREVLMVLSLREAESVRRSLVSLRRKSFLRARVSEPTARVALTLWRIDEDAGLRTDDASAMLAHATLHIPASLVTPESAGTAATVESTSAASPIGGLDQLAALAAQARFFDASLWFAPPEMAALLNAAKGSSRRSREAVFSSLLALRHRERADWHGSPLAPFFHFQTTQEWQAAARRLLAMSTRPQCGVR